MKVLCVILLSTVITACYSQSEEQAWKIYYDSTNLFWNKDWSKALALLKKAEEDAVTDLGIYDENYLTIVNDIGLVYWKLQDFPNAEKFLSRTLDLKKEYFATDDSQLFISASNLAGLYAEEGDLKKSKEVYQNFVRPRESIVDSEVYDITLDNLLSLYSLHHSPDTALQLIDNLKNKISTNDALSNFRIQLFKIRLLRKNRDYETARILLEKLSDELKATSSADQLFIESLYELGGIYTETGFFNHAEKNLLEASRLLKETDKAASPMQIKIFNSLAFVYEQLNIYDKAIEYYQQSLDLCVSIKGQKSIQCATLKNNIADVWLKNGELTKAIQSYESLLESLNGIVAESDPLYLTSLNNLATAYRKNNQQKKALEVLEKALSSIHHNRLPENDLMATILNNVAIIHTESGEYHKAAELYKKSYDIKKSIYGENSIQLFDLAGNLAVVYWAMHRHDAAIPLFKKSMELALRHVRYVFPNLNEAEQVQFYRKLKEDFERFNTMAIQLSDADPSLVVQMFDNQLAIKSIVFFTQHRRSSVLSDSKDSLLTVQFGLVKAKRDALGKLYQSPSQGSESAAMISRLEKEIDALEKSISVRTSSTQVRDDVNWKVLQGSLKEKDAIVDIIRFRKYDHKDHHGLHKVFGFTDSVYYAALITTRETTQKPELVLFRDGVNFESRFLNYYKNALNFEVDDKFTYNFYWEPIARYLQGKSKIYLSLDGVYHKINLNTLRDPSNGEYVLQKYDIVHVLNASQILDKRSAKRISHDAVLIGDPVFDVDLEYPASHRGDDFRFGSLPGTMKEVKTIEAILQDNLWRIKTLVKSEATESNLKSVSSPEVLHIASHGYFSTDIVQLNELAKKEFLFHSGLVLAGANKSQSKDNRDFDNDGIVTAYEVMNLDLSETELVVLSACETGLGVVENGEGVHGLQRSFLQAGARQVLISLWKVDDEITKELMIRFYQNIVNGKPTREALKQAQLDLIDKNYNPYFWGGFVMVGSE